MSDLTFLTETLVKAVTAHTARATLPFQQAHTGRMPGTAFWYNDLVDATPEHERIRQFLVTAEAVTRYELAQWTLRAELCEPSMSAEFLLMRDFADGWIRLPDLGIAVMPTAGLYAHAQRKGWQWTTDEITEGLAATESDLETLGSTPSPALVLGHDVGPRGERLQAAVVGGAFHAPDGALRWDRALPDGFTGAPVFVGRLLDESRFKLVCLGVVLPGERHNVIIGFDRIRSAIRALP
jgi:hypothetical protein